MVSTSGVYIIQWCTLKYDSTEFLQESDILDSSVQFWTEMSNFGQKCPILDSSVQFWTEMSNFGLLLDTSVQYLTLISDF